MVSTFHSHFLTFGCSLAVVAAVTVPVCDAAAQSPSEERAPSETRQLETVTIRARKSIEQRFFAAGSLVTVDRQDIEGMGAESVADVLRQLPGVQVNANGNGDLDIRMRGMDKSATQVLVDGEKVGGSRQGAQLPIDQLPADLIERIEVLRAPSAEHAGVTGGTINIVLRQPTVTSETNLRVIKQYVWGQSATQGFFSRTGPLSSSKSGESEVTPAQPWTYFLAGGGSDRLTGSDIRRSITTSTFGATPAAGSGQSKAQSDDHYRFRTAQWWLMPRLSGRLGPLDQVNLRATLVGTQVRGQFDSLGTGQDGFGPIASQVIDHTASERGSYQVRGDWTHRLKGSRLETFLSAQSNSEQLNRTRGQSLSSSQIMPSGSSFLPSAFADDQRERAVTLSGKLTGTVDPLLWMLGTELEERRLTVDTASSVGLNAVPQRFGLGARTRRGVVWGQNEWELPATTTLTAGLRLENTETRSDYSGTLASHQRSFLQPSLHTRTPVSDTLQVRLNLARVSRNPVLTDLIDRRVPSVGLNTPNNPDVAGNPGLRPESSWTFDGGLEHKLGEQGQVGLNLFVRQIKNVIARRITDNGVGLWTQRPENAGNATVWGLEGDIKTGLDWPKVIGWGRDWTLAGNASLLQSRMTSGDSVGQRVPGQARYLVNVNLAKPMPKTSGWFGGTTLAFNGAADLNTSPTSTGRELAYHSLDAYLGQVVPSWGYWRLTVYNITNSARSRSRADVDSAGRSTLEQSSLRWTPRVFLTLGTRF